jgi:hypothetical protein
LKKFFAPITHAINILHQLHCIHIPATRGATINRYTLVPSSQAKVGTHEKPRRFFNTLDLLLNPPTNHPKVARAPETIHATASFCSQPKQDGITIVLRQQTAAETFCPSQNPIFIRSFFSRHKQKFEPQQGME